MVIKSPAAATLRGGESKTAEATPRGATVVTRGGESVSRVRQRPAVASRPRRLQDVGPDLFGSSKSDKGKVVMPASPSTSIPRHSSAGSAPAATAASRMPVAPAASRMPVAPATAAASATTPATPRKRVISLDVAEVAKEVMRRGADFTQPGLRTDKRVETRGADAAGTSVKPAEPRKRSALELRLEKPWFETRKLKPPTAKQQRSAIQILAVSVLILAVGILYIQHGFRMQEKMDRLQELEMALQRTRHLYTEKSLQYDRLTGPNEIYRRAQAAGFVNSGPADNRLTISDSGL